MVTGQEIQISITTLAAQVNVRVSVDLNGSRAEEMNLTFLLSLRRKQPLGLCQCVLGYCGRKGIPMKGRDAMSPNCVIYIIE